jgi:hypothetical protein
MWVLNNEASISLLYLLYAHAVPLRTVPTGISKPLHTACQPAILWQCCVVHTSWHKLACLLLLLSELPASVHACNDVHCTLWPGVDQSLRWLAVNWATRISYRQDQTFSYPRLSYISVFWVKVAEAWSCPLNYVNAWSFAFTQLFMECVYYTRIGHDKA